MQVILHFCSSKCVLIFNSIFIYYKNITSGSIAWMNCIMGYIHRVNCVSTCHFIMAYTKIPILSQLIISVNKVSGSEGDDHCGGGAVCVCVGKAEAMVSGHRSF